ncbi:MAG TPA: WD40 repeat domain-containing protein [Gemmataceae bacterium]|nr:WD40 repeat domain-containing protein [Gemmataceae bacterium]
MTAHPEHDRLQAYLDGNLEADAVVELEARLRLEPGLAAALVYLAREEAICKEWASVTVLAGQEAAGKRIVRGPAQRRRWVSRQLLALSLIAGCAFLLLLGGIARRHPNSTPTQTALASLEDIQGLVEIISPEGEVQAGHLGQLLLAGQEIRTGDAGATTVRYPHDNGRLMLGSETRVRLESDTSAPKGTTTKVFVMEGVVSAEVPTNSSGNKLVLHNQLAELHAASGRYSFASLPEGAFLETDSGHGTFIRKTDRSIVDVSGGHFAIASLDQPFRARNVPHRVTAPRRTMVEGAGPVLGISFDPEGTKLTSFTSDGARRWDLSSDRPTQVIRANVSARLPTDKPRSQKEPHRPFACSVDGSVLALVPDEHVIRLFDGASGNERNSWRTSKRVTAVALSPDGRTLAAALSNNKDTQEVRLFDTEFGLERTILSGQNGQITCLAFSASGDYLATASADRSIKIWQVHNLVLMRSFAKSPVEPRALAFSPDGRDLAIGERRGSLRIVDVESGAQRYLLTGHLRDIWSVAFSPDGRWLLSGAADNTARLWDVREGVELTTFKVPANIVSSVAFSPDGQLLATGTWDKKVLLWNLPPLARP